MRTGSGCFFRAALARESATVLGLGRGSKAAQEWESFIAEEREGFGRALIMGHQPGELEAGQLAVGHPV